MRQARAPWVVVAAVIVVLGALAIFGFGRSWWRHSGNGDHGDAGHGQVDGSGHHNAQRDHHDEVPELSGELVDGVRVIDVAAHNFKFVPATIVVRQGENVRLQVTSKDVTHGIGIEAYDIDRKLDPGKTETIEFAADKPGRHHFHCSIYCGAGHGDMHGELVVVAHN